jgi:hypothetical protein
MRKLWITLALGLIGGVTVAQADKDLRIPYLKKSDPPDAILYDTPGNSMPTAGHEFEFYQVKVAAWTDGRIVWSSNLPDGGYPYYSDRIEPTRIEQFLKQSTEVSSATRSLKQYIIVDSRYTTLIARPAMGVGLKLMSSHPAFAKNEKLKIEAGGISVASDQATTKPLTEKDQSFNQFRQDFDNLQQSLLNLAPTTTTKAAQRLKFEWFRNSENE